MSQSVERALRVLPALAGGPARLGAVADVLRVHKSTALRPPRTLRAHGFVYRRPDGRHRLGAARFALAPDPEALLGLPPPVRRTADTIGREHSASGDEHRDDPEQEGAP